MRRLLADVAAFHFATGTPVLKEPALPSPERRDLRQKLIREEYNEYMLAEVGHDLVGIADSLADLVYVVVGTALEYGIPLDKVWNAVQQANMRKIDPSTGKVRKREDGKVLKPEGWVAPPIETLVFPTPAVVETGPAAPTESVQISSFEEFRETFGIPERAYEPPPKRAVMVCPARIERRQPTTNNGSDDDI